MNHAEVAEKFAVFESIYFPYPPHLEFHETCQYLIELGRATRGSSEGRASAGALGIRQNRNGQSIRPSC